MAVKATKRLMRNNVGTNGNLDNDRFLRALLQMRNTPDPDCNISPAEIIFGKPLRDSLSFVNRLQKFSNPHIRPAWREAWAAKEESLRTRYARSREVLNTHAQQLPALHCGEKCFVQNGSGNYPNRWDRTGIITEVLDHDKYVVKIDGSGRVSTRNRKFLRVYKPATMDIALHAPNPLTAQQGHGLSQEMAHHGRARGSSQSRNTHLTPPHPHDMQPLASSTEQFALDPSAARQI